MDIEKYRDFCLSLPVTEETTPFDDDVVVYKVGGKMFTYATIGDFTQIGVKCEPEKLIEYKEKYPEIGNAPHMSKIHWMALGVMGDLSDEFIKERIEDSYNLVIKGITRAKREEILSAVRHDDPGR